MDPDYLDALFLLHRDMPRQGPGSVACTRAAIRCLPDLPANPRIFDLGCGPGAQTLVLAQHFQSLVIAVDIHISYLEQLQRNAIEAGLNQFIETRQGRIEELDEPPGTIDLIWLEGAIYLVGFEAGLTLFRPMLRAGGVVAATEITWLTDSPAEELRAFWKSAYPALTTVEGNIQHARDAGYDVLDHFVLPPSAWWDNYYTPLKNRIDMLRPQANVGSALAKVLDEAECEMTMHERFDDAYSYVFYILRRS